MSLILDALKKSDNERKRQSSPSISDVRNAEKKPETPRWILGFIALLIVNLLVLIFVLTRGDGEAESVTDTTTVVLDGPTDTMPITPPDYSNNPRGQREPVRSLAAEAAPVRAAPNESVANRSQAGSRAPSETAPAPVNQREAAALERFEQTDTRDLPTLASLKANGAISLPELHIDLHVFHQEPSRRLVFINGTKYAEGQTLSEGPSVTSIRTDGVVLNHRSVEFLLPRE